MQKQVIPKPTVETLKQFSTESIQSTENAKSPMNIIQNFTESEHENQKNTSKD